VTPATARWAGQWADGLITIHQPPERLREVLGAFDEGGGEGKRRCVQVHVSWAPDDDEALCIAHDQWRSNVCQGDLNWDLVLVEQFDELARFVRPEDVRDAVLVSADLQRHLGWLEEVVALGVDEIYLHHVGKVQEPFIEAFAGSVLPKLVSAR
jgi:alkanesulfonate monooxygenase SsuD/methylene tetrahydromethanopterin reductase-like flavin-dependent oxidoreductase (luciferase family)